MGACYGKGSGPHDPDKAPYERDERRRRRGNKKVSGERETDRQTAGDKLEDNSRDVESPPKAVVTAVDSDDTTQVSILLMLSDFKDHWMKFKLTIPESRV